MPVTINGSGSIAGLAVGGLPDGSVDADTLASNAVTTTKIANGAASGSKIVLPSGAVLQTVGQRLSASRVQMAGSSYTELGDDAIITPSASSNKILITMTISIHCSSSNTQILMDVARKIGGGSYTNNLSGFSYGVISCASNNDWNGQHLQFLDSPNTTSAVTYKLSTRAADSSTVYLNDNGAGTGSFITLMEIKA